MTTLQRLRTGVRRLSVLARILAACLVVAVALSAMAALRPTTAAEAKTAAKRQFFYHGGAYVVGGSLYRVDHRPPTDALGVHGATMVPFSGGKGRSELVDFGYPASKDPKARRLVRIGRATTDVEGRSEPPNEAGHNADTKFHITTVTTVIEGLELADKVKVGRMRLQLATRRSSAEGSEASFTSSAEMSGLTIGGVTLPVVFKTQHATDQSLASMVEKHQKGAGWMVGPDDAPYSFTSLFTGRRSAEKSPILEDRLVLTSLFERVGNQTLVEEMTTKNPGKDKGPFLLLPGNGIHIPDFANVYFGQLLISRNEHRATLLHLEFGSPDGGDADVCAEYGNGYGYPP
jgi:hypothetical protein